MKIKGACNGNWSRVQRMISLHAKEGKDRGKARAKPCKKH